MTYRCDSFWSNICCDDPKSCNGRIYISDGEYCECPKVGDPWYFIEMEVPFYEDMGKEEYFDWLEHRVEDGDLRLKDKKEVIKYFEGTLT